MVAYGIGIDSAAMIIEMVTRECDWENARPEYAMKVRASRRIGCR
jgi:hypothetical protein